MKCIRCGRPAKISRKVYIDGALKEIRYCTSCFLEMIKYESANYSRAGVNTLTLHMELVQETKLKENEFVSSIERIYSEQPSIVQLTLFSNDRHTYRRALMDIQKRELTFLNYKLKNALISEDYKKAGKIKEKMDEIMRTLKETPEQ
ncbi:MAG: hypothetical protein WBH69_08150 [Fervidobacterium sp.]